jgi:3-hydroxyacyl-CoA dehydrogenase
MDTRHTGTFDREEPKMRNITVLGTGVLGSQIIYQTAYHGFKVTAYNVRATSLDKARERISALSTRYLNDLPDATPEKIQAGLDNISYSSDLAQAVKDADMVIEALPEDMATKETAYTELAAVAPAKTIFATNSSSLLPSSLMPFTGRPDRFIALHYANEVWTHNTAEIMGTSETSPEVYQELVRFAKETGMVPIQIKKEKAGYLLNSLLIPFLNAGSKLFGGGYAEPADIDATWRIATGAPAGPFQILDIVGLKTAYNIMSMSPDPEVIAFAKIVKENYIDKGKLGVATGEGFYKYAK